MSDTEIIRYCAPTLAGLKTASLFTTPCEDYERLRPQILRINAKLRQNGLRMIPLCLRRGRALIYIYRESALAKDILRGAARRVLETLGYMPEDVCAGVWKAYSHEEEAEKTFSLYQRCTELYTKRLESGEPIDRLIVKTN